MTPAVDDIYHGHHCLRQAGASFAGRQRPPALVEGKSRAVLRAVTQEEPYFVGALDEVLNRERLFPSKGTLLRTAHHYFEEYCKMSGRISGETMQSVLGNRRSGVSLADIIAANVLSKIEDRQQVLEEFDELARLESVCARCARNRIGGGVEKEGSGARPQAD